jgi:hypothetical protein
MKIYDCFPFFNELDLLEIRLHELNEVVDYFVIVEGERTHQNESKPLYYKELMDDTRFSKFKNKIIQITIPQNEFNGNTAHNEQLQFSAVVRGLSDASPDDLIMLSALDEIPKASTLAQVVAEGVNRPKVFKQNFYYFYLDTRYTEKPSTDEMFCLWNGTILFRYRVLEATNIYQLFLSRYTSIEKVDDGGWHFSFMGDAKNAHIKLHSYLHPEFRHLTLEELDNFRTSLIDPMGRSETQFIKFDSLADLPKYVQDNLEKYKTNIRQLN